MAAREDFPQTSPPPLAGAEAGHGEHVEGTRVWLRRLNAWSVREAHEKSEPGQPRREDDISEAEVEAEAREEPSISEGVPPAGEPTRHLI